MDAFEALKIFYGGAEDGYAPEDFEINERERGIFIPEMLKDFLGKYGYMSVNRLSDSVRLLHPNIMSERVFRYGEDRALNLTIIGRIGEFKLAVAESTAADPGIFLLQITPEQAQILPSDDTLTEIFKVMLCSALLNEPGAQTVEDPVLAVRLLRENFVDLDRISCNPSLRREYSVNFSEELRTFVAAEFVEGELARFFFASSERFAPLDR